MSKHTPGPWKFHRSVRASNFGGYRAGVFGPEAALVAYAHGGNSDDRDVAEANARLIAAAPDLLAALRRLVAEDNLHAYQQAVDAIAKADPEGPSQGQRAERISASVRSASDVATAGETPAGPANFPEYAGGHFPGDGCFPPHRHPVHGNETDAREPKS
jgi:hypothetical protein